MPLLTIRTSQDFAPVGTHNAKFVGIEPIENKWGNGYRWVFETNEGKKISGFSDRDKPPTPNNITGRWLSALSKQPATDGARINTDDFIGKPYMLIVAPNGDNKTKLETFSATW